MNTKMVGVIITSLNMRKGKIAAQFAHGAIACYQNAIQQDQITEAFLNWKNGNYAKICVGISTLDELFILEKKAQELGIFCHLVIDNGITEFHGEKTITCGVFGPDYSNKLDQLTGDLKLL